jgi:hypothetical protein
MYICLLNYIEAIYTKFLKSWEKNFGKKMGIFNLRQFLTENKLTSNSNQLKELDVRRGGNIQYLAFEEAVEKLIDHGTRNGTLESVGRDILKIF